MMFHEYLIIITVILGIDLFLSVILLMIIIKGDKNAR